VPDDRAKGVQPVPVELPPIDDDVYAALQARAVPLEDDINSVLRKLLGLGGVRPESGSAANGGRADIAAQSSARPRPQKKSQKKRTRVPKGSILPEAEYEIPILRALVEMNGRGPTSEVIALVEKELDPKLTAVDREKLSAGDVRWKNRAQFVRLKLVEKGEMASGSPRGTWEISDLGRKRLEAEG
jgi:hypothetical protein